jgi:hypothetical protein
VLEILKEVSILDNDKEETTNMKKKEKIKKDIQTLESKSLKDDFALLLLE